MSLSIVQCDRQHYILLTYIQSVLLLSDRDFQQTLEQYQLAKTKAMVTMTSSQGTLVTCKSACRFLQWWLDKSYHLQPETNALLHSLRRFTKTLPKRAMSRSLRIEIAYRQRYACRLCGLFPIPPTFEVDHIIVLQDGGQDIADNLQAICVTCHANKTRQNRLSKNPIFRQPVVDAKPAEVFSSYFHRSDV